MCSKKVYVFDFDGTLTNGDTFIEFIRFSKGTCALVLGLLRYLPILLLMKCRLYANWRAKQQVFAHFFAGMTIDEFNQLCQRFGQECRHLLRPQGQELVSQLLEEQADVLVVSASMENWVREFLDARVVVSATQIEVMHGVLTGRLLGRNCYGQEKVERIRNLFPQRDTYQLIAYGDSRGDKEMLDYADERHYRPFR